MISKNFYTYAKAQDQQKKIMECIIPARLMSGGRDDTYFKQ
jgi:hypothetical protein